MPRIEPRPERCLAVAAGSSAMLVFRTATCMVCPAQCAQATFGIIALGARSCLGALCCTWPRDRVYTCFVPSESSHVITAARNSAAATLRARKRACKLRAPVR